MAEVFETDEHAYRACIFYEAVRKTSLEDAYKNMKEVKPNIDFLDFEYWYRRFSNGNHDLNHDRSTDPTLSDMPTDVMEKIVGYLGLVGKLSARKVCRQLRTMVDDQTSEFGDVELSITEKSCEILYEFQKFEYFAQENGNCLLKTPRKTIPSKGDHSVLAFREFASVLTHPKWSFENVTICIKKEDPHAKNERKLIIFLNSLLSNHRIHVNSLHIGSRTLELLATVLPHFEAHSLSFNCCSPIDSIDLLDVIVKMDKWKNVKEFHIVSLPDGFPIEALFHARRVKVYDFKITKDHLEKIRDILFESPTFECFVFHEKTNQNSEDLEVLMDRVMSVHDTYDPVFKLYRIETSMDYIRISNIKILINGAEYKRHYIERIRNFFG